MRTHSSVARWLTYEPTLGNLTWIKGPKKGGLAGYKWGQRYCVTMGGDRFNAADLAWLLHTGEWPATPVAQYDEDPSNIALENLYLSTPKAKPTPGMLPKARITKPRKSSPTGVPGVSPYGDRFKATVSFAGAQNYLGIFNSVPEAKAAIDKWHADRITAQRELQNSAITGFSRP